MKKILFFTIVLFCAAVSYFVFSEAPLSKMAILQASIGVNPVVPTQDTEKIFPGNFIVLKANVKNSGSLGNAPGEIFIRFNLPNPLNDYPQSKLFETEHQSLPSILPGQNLE